MTTPRAIGQHHPYKMGNAGDLLKHGVLAEYIRWRHEENGPVRFIDLFGGEPRGKIEGKLKNRILALPDESALRCAQTEIDRSWYLGSGLVASNAGAAHVLTNDLDPGRRKRLREAGLGLVAEGFPNCPAEAHGWDAYRMLREVVRELRVDDLVLVDPFSRFLPDHAKDVIPLLDEAVMERQAAVLLFALNPNPGNHVGKRFDTLLAKHLPRAWRITCPPHPELKYYADVVLAAPSTMTRTGPAVEFRLRLEGFVEHLRDALFPFSVRVVEGQDSRTGSQQHNGRVQSLHRLFKLFDGNDPAAEVRRLKLEDEEDESA